MTIYLKYFLQFITAFSLVMILSNNDLEAKRSSNSRYSYRTQSSKSYKVKSYSPRTYKPKKISSYPSFKSSTFNSSSSKPKRSRAVRSSFHRSNPCPSTGRNRGSCPGYEVDHIVPLACGGSDSVGNMQWLTKTANRRKGAMGCRRR